MPTPAVLLIADDPDDVAALEILRRNIARSLSAGADQHRAAGRHDVADRLDAAALRFDPAMRN